MLNFPFTWRDVNHVLRETWRCCCMTATYLNSFRSVKVPVGLALPSAFPKKKKKTSSIYSSVQNQGTHLVLTSKWRKAALSMQSFTALLYNWRVFSVLYATFFYYRRIKLWEKPQDVRVFCYSTMLGCQQVSSEKSQTERRTKCANTDDWGEMCAS